MATTINSSAITVNTTTLNISTDVNATLGAQCVFPSGHMVYKGILFQVPPLYSSGVTSYSNNKDNLVNTGSLSTTITTTITNSKIWIYGMFTRGDDASHSNSDIKRTISGSAVWVSEVMSGYESTGDGLYADWRDQTGYQLPHIMNVMDAPNVASGTQITYALYHGSWSADDLTVNQYQNNDNDNADITSHIYYWEVYP
tara:strand:- start:1745 stop:2341 length:597 start_codon:yes stop_codon:yes gene_type:complete